MARRVLMTGGSGFVGQWLSRRLLRRGWSVFAGGLGVATGPAILTAEERASITALTMDVRSEGSVRDAIERADPEWVVHLAAIAFAPRANATPAAAFDVNALGAMRLLTCLAEGGRGKVRVLVVGSAEQYGAQAEARGPLTEAMPTAPLSAYAASKATQELIALQMARGAHLHVVCTRSFNHSGYGHGEQYLIPSLVGRARALPKRGGTLTLGNASPVRDYLHVADVVAAYEALLDRGVAGEVYNVSSGQPVSVREIAERVLKRSGVSAEISTDPTLVRAGDMPTVVGDSSKLRSATGWAPSLTLDDIIDDLIHAKAR